MVGLFDSLSGRTRFTHFCAVLNNIFQTTGSSSDVIPGRFWRPIVLDKCVKFDDLSLNRSQEILPEAVGGGIFEFFFAITSDRK